MVTLIVREFIIDAPVRAAWDHLAHLEQWPSWARNITRIDRALCPNVCRDESQAGKELRSAVIAT
jgi:hypothetical protein